MDTSITAISVNMLQEFPVVSTTKIIVLPRTITLAIGKVKGLS